MHTYTQWILSHVHWCLATKTGGSRIYIPISIFSSYQKTICSIVWYLKAAVGCFDSVFWLILLLVLWPGAFNTNLAPCACISLYSNETFLLIWTQATLTPVNEFGDIFYFYTFWCHLDFTFFVDESVCLSWCVPGLWAQHHRRSLWAVCARLLWKSFPGDSGRLPALCLPPCRHLQ